MARTLLVGIGVASALLSVRPAFGAIPPAAAGSDAANGSAPPSSTSVLGTSVLGTSVLSIRRIPEWIDDNVAGPRLAPALKAFMAGPAVAIAGVQACLEVSQGGRVIYADNSTLPLLPASNMKLLTTTAALDKLGPSFRFTTKVEADRAPVGGVETGNLYLIGGGDPFLRTADYVASFHDPEPLYTSLAQLAAQVKAAGISEVDGAVIGDESRYDSLRTVPTWKPAYAAEGDAGPLSALEVNDGYQLTAPAGPAADPPVQAAQVFSTLLTAEGVRVAGPAAAATTPASAADVTSIQSAPLSQVIPAILLPSDDTAAELLTKELGVDFGSGGTTAAGTAVIRADLAADGLPMAGIVVDDGSGLDRGDLVTCALLDALLTRSGHSGVVAHGLPVAGETGTLEGRFKGTAAAGRLEAKTGTLEDVTALSGFVAVGASPATPALGQPVVFSFVANGISLVDGALAGDQLGVLLTTYPKVPPVPGLGPAPITSNFPNAGTP